MRPRIYDFIMNSPLTVSVNYYSGDMGYEGKILMYSAVRPQLKENQGSFREMLDFFKNTKTKFVAAILEEKF